MFVSESEILVPEGDAPHLEEAFRHRLRQVDQHEGFLGLELLRDLQKPGRFVLITRWQEQKQFHAYLRSPHFKLAHQRQHPHVSEPKGGGRLRQFVTVEID